MCWKDGGRLHKVGLNSTGQLPLNVAKTLHDENLLLRLNNVLNAVDTAINNVHYHLGLNLPPSLFAFLKYVILGSKWKVGLSAKQKDTIDMTRKNISEISMKSVETERKLNYEVSIEYLSSTQTPFLFGRELYRHLKTKYKRAINISSDLNGLSKGITNRG